MAFNLTNFIIGRVVAERQGLIEGDANRMAILAGVLPSGPTSLVVVNEMAKREAASKGAAEAETAAEQPGNVIVIKPPPDDGGDGDDGDAEGRADDLDKLKERVEANGKAIAALRERCSDPNVTATAEKAAKAAIDKTAKTLAKKVDLEAANERIRNAETRLNAVEAWQKKQEGGSGTGKTATKK